MKIPTEDRARDRSRSSASPRLARVTLLLAVLALPAWAGSARTEFPRMLPIAQYLIADPASEVALARTAAPPSIADKAAVLTLGRHGYETAVKGSNGFVCLIFRSWSNDFDYADFWDPRIRTPQCWNAAAARSLLPDYLTRTQWVLAGVSREEMAARTKAGLADHRIRPPAVGSMAYMMSKDQFINEPSPANGPARWYPHVMFFVAATDGSPWGANVAGGPLFSATSDAEPITTYFVVVPKWSDGTLGPYPPKPGTTQGHHRHG